MLREDRSRNQRADGQSEFTRGQLRRTGRKVQAPQPATLARNRPRRHLSKLFLSLVKISKSHECAHVLVNDVCSLNDSLARLITTV